MAAWKAVGSAQAAGHRPIALRIQAFPGQVPPARAGNSRPLWPSGQMCVCRGPLPPSCIARRIHVETASEYDHGKAIKAIGDPPAPWERGACPLPWARHEIRLFLCRSSPLHGGSCRQSHLFLCLHLPLFTHTPGAVFPRRRAPTGHQKGQVTSREQQDWVCIGGNPGHSSRSVFRGVMHGTATRGHGDVGARRRVCVKSRTEAALSGRRPRASAEVEPGAIRRLELAASSLFKLAWNDGKNSPH